MIFPNMATMLAFIFTDFAIDRETLASFTKRAVDESFNRISVDGDTSTSDTVFVSTTNKKNLKITTEEKLKALDKFYTELQKAMVDLAKKIVMDGEGAKKFIEITVENSKSVQRAKKNLFFNFKLTPCKNCNCWRGCKLGTTYNGYRKNSD